MLLPRCRSLPEPVARGWCIHKHVSKRVYALPMFGSTEHKAACMTHRSGSTPSGVQFRFTLTSLSVVTHHVTPTPPYPTALQPMPPRPTAGDKGLKVVISGSTGCIREWNMGGQPLLTEGVTPCFFRACIDNDRGGTGGRSYASRYKSSACRLLSVVGQAGRGGGGSARYGFHASSACFTALALSTTHPLPPNLQLPSLNLPSLISLLGGRMLC